MGGESHEVVESHTFGGCLKRHFVADLVLDKEDGVGACGQLGDDVGGVGSCVARTARVNTLRVAAVEGVLAEIEQVGCLGALTLADVLVDVLVPESVLEHSEGRLGVAGAVECLGKAEIDVLQTVEIDAGGGVLLVAGLCERRVSG